MEKNEKPVRGSLQEQEAAMRPYMEYLAYLDSKIMNTTAVPKEFFISKPPTCLSDRIIITSNPRPNSWLESFQRPEEEK